MKPQEPIPHNYPMSRLNAIFAISALVLLAVTGGIVFYDYVRGWKWFQMEFMRIQQERIEQELKERNDADTRAKLAALDKEMKDRQVEIANRILGTLDPFYLRDGAHTRFERPSIESMLSSDPSEAVRSTDVYPLVKKHFDVLYERFYNGTLLHQLHPLLNTDLANRGQRDFDSIIRLILLMEDLLIKNQVLPSDFVFAIAQKRDSSVQRPG